MPHLLVHGGKKLSGIIEPSGNKNSALPLICASLLASSPVTINNLPDITDVEKILTFIESIGAKVCRDKFKKSVVIDPSNINGLGDWSLPEGIRSAVLLIAPLLLRLGSVRLHTDSKGCSLGMREIDPHVQVFKKFGADVSGFSPTLFSLSKPSQPCDVWLEYSSVTTTENFLMCAALTEGRSTINNAAAEPHVQDLCNLLQKMGVDIQGIGTSRLVVLGRKQLEGAEISVSDDHHEIATFLAIGAATGGEIKVLNRVKQHFPLITSTFAKLGVQIVDEGPYSVVRERQELRVQEPHTPQILPKIEAAPWPYIPADLLPPFIALSACCHGEVLVWNKVYEGALAWLPELAKFGVRITQCDPHRAIIHGNKSLHSANAEAPYIIRVIIALFMVAARCPGQSIIHNAHPIKRAHPNFVENLRKLGAEVEWVS